MKDGGYSGGGEGGEGGVFDFSNSLGESDAIVEMKQYFRLSQLKHR